MRRPPTATGWWGPTAASSRSAPPPSTAPWAASRCSARWWASRRPHPERLLARGLRRRDLQLRRLKYYGSIPGLGLHPAGSGLPNSLNAPIVGMVPTFTGHGYFMVASDGGVFAFGDAQFEGSCPGIGGCAGRGRGRDAGPHRERLLAGDESSATSTPSATPPSTAAPPPSSVPVVDAVATPDGHGYWLLYANGAVDSFGDAANLGAPVGYVNAFNPAAAIFPTADGQGYWVASARGDVFSYGDAPYLGQQAAAGLNGEIIAAFGF